MPATLERMLLHAAVDPDFRRESARFGVEQLPESVQEQDQEFLDLLNDDMQVGAVSFKQTCNWGFTIVCDMSLTCPSGE
jgi:hypothetical protein